MHVVFWKILCRNFLTFDFKAHKPNIDTGGPFSIHEKNLECYYCQGWITNHSKSYYYYTNMGKYCEMLALIIEGHSIWAENLSCMCIVCNEEYNVRNY
jgi:hypothetical protein